jgi:hypothetical protein
LDFGHVGSLTSGKHPGSHTSITDVELSGAARFWIDMVKIGTFLEALENASDSSAVDTNVARDVGVSNSLLVPGDDTSDFSWGCIDHR